MLFADVLASLPLIDHLSALELLDGETLVARIENKPGQAGSVRVYHALYQEFGAINAVAAAKGLRLYAEHSSDAQAFPGKHPNIDRLIALAENGKPLAVKLINAKV
ncbi:DUF2322 family protein [Iodobacter fluviatilis]|uniref:Uncharacterized protein conserved in bacteria n=1 Tax=Iodobacter fluviatilis TaxID=537 RepID=A0A377Q4D4_9NEIS|nr:DUF2322 family protein [Iodobacter fluviatilis]TCU90553.1 hypothetical protein EV682_101587 [Iodobacter fluviatilis]STQ89580.1 Uncharacterized protein conserved in bacteria [Iodobacter fluviatilis]